MLFDPYASLPQTVSAAIQVVRARRRAAVAERRAGAALDALATVTERAGAAHAASAPRLPAAGAIVLPVSLAERIASSVERIETRLNASTPGHNGKADSSASGCPATTSPYLQAPEAASYLRTTVQTIYDWVKHGKLHPEPGFEGRLVFTKEALDRFARTRRRRR